MAIRSSPLRARRLQCGLTQAQLATRAGVSRQLVAAVEAGRNVPAVDAALSLARALRMDVEALFADTTADVVPALGGAVVDGTAVRVGRVGDQLVACGLPDHGISGAGWARADGVIGAGELRLFEHASPAGAVLAGCDPALGVAEAILGGFGPQSLLAISAPTDTAVRALELGRVHAAVVHGLDTALPVPPVPVIRWHLARWQVGLAGASWLRERSLEAVLCGDLAVVHRDPGAASQQAFQRASIAAGIVSPPPGPRAAGHLDAARLAALLDGIAVTTEAAAHAFGLTFRALEDHVVEVWVAAGWAAHPGIQALAEVIASSAFTRRIEQFGGYDLARCGQRS